MDECIICTEQCSDRLKCCNVAIHAQCLCDLVRNKHTQCPHCRTKLYEPVVDYVPIGMPDDRREETCMSSIYKFTVIILALYGLTSMTVDLTKEYYDS